MADSIFDRPGKLSKIYHLAPASYYTDLLLAENTKAYSKLTAEQCLKYKSKAKAKGAPAPPRGSSAAAPAMAALEDGADEAILLQMPDEELQLASVSCKEPSLKEAKVLYDRFTHSSGNLRCFTACVHHRDCRRYVFVKNHGNKE